MSRENLPHEISSLTREIVSASENADISIDINQLHMLQVHARLLLTWNKKMNLTRIRDPKEIAARHFLEGLIAGDLLKRKNLSGPLLDLGSGNGFPGVPMAIACPGALPLTLVESSEKKGSFLRVLLRELGWESSRVLVRRIDHGDDLAGLPCRIFTSRGVALFRLLEEGLTFLDSGAHAVLFAARPPEAVQDFTVEEFCPLRGRENGILLIRKT